MRIIDLISPGSRKDAGEFCLQNAWKKAGTLKLEMLFLTVLLRVSVWETRENFTLPHLKSIPL